MPISAKWKHKSSIHIGFIVFNGGVTTFFAKSVSKEMDHDHRYKWFCHGTKHKYIQSFVLSESVGFSSQSTSNVDLWFIFVVILDQILNDYVSDGLQYNIAVLVVSYDISNKTVSEIS